jgi:hypothetical protein
LAKVALINADITKYPAVQKFVVPLVHTSINALLRNIFSLNERATENILTFPTFNGKLCSLINPISSTRNDSFKMDGLLLAVNNDKGLPAQWIMNLLGKKL